MGHNLEMGYKYKKKAFQLLLFLALRSRQLPIGCRLLEPGALEPL